MLRGAVVLVVAQHQGDPALFQLDPLARVEQGVQLLGGGCTRTARTGRVFGLFLFFGAVAVLTFFGALVVVVIEAIFP